jgi:glyoxylase-like metal-dependent hydrolase (beta-lactamase superfamily II)
VAQVYRVPGGELPVRMTLVRLRDGGLWVHSPLAVDAKMRAEIDRLGPVRAVVAPCRFHFLDVNSFRASYPESVLFISPGLARKWRSLPFTGVLDDRPPRAWEGDLQQLVFRGHPALDEVVFFHPASRTLILTDLMMSAHAESHRLWRTLGKVAQVYDKPSPPAGILWTFFPRSLARKSMQRILDWDFDRIVFAHGNPIPTDGKRIFHEAFQQLLG